MVSSSQTKDRAHKLNAATLERIKQGYKFIHGKEMSNADLQGMDLSDAKIYLAAAKRKVAAKPAIKVPVAKLVSSAADTKQTATELPKEKSKKGWIVGAILVLIVFIAISPSKEPETKIVEPTATTQAAAEEAQPEQKEQTTATPTPPPVAQPAPTPPPPAPVPAPAPSPTPAASNCHPSYSGECVPITSDADCAGGSGNGPAYVYSTVRVVGPDEYGLDRDGNGLGCE